MACDLPSWTLAALRELGQSEVPGSESNPRIVQYLASMGQPKSVRLGDETAWCSAFAGFCLETVGVAHAAKLNARSWLSQGMPLAYPQLGAITVLWRESPDSWKGHVGFYFGSWGDSVLLLGGNQRNRVCIAPYPKKRVLGYRWPLK